MKVPAMRPPPLKNPGLVPNGSLPLSPLHLDRLGLFNPDLMWRYQQQFGSSPHAPMSPLLDVKSRLPQSLATDPRSWTRDDVTLFLRWCEQEYDLPTVDQERFQMNGKAMCVLTKTDLSDRTGGAGDVIFNVLQMLLREVPYYGRVSQSPITPQQHSFMPFPQNGNALMSPPASARTPNSATWLPRSPFFVAETNGLGHLIQQTNSVAITDQKQNSPTEVKPLSFVNSNGSLAGSSSNSGSQSESEESSREAGSPRRSPVPSLISAPQSPATFSPTSKLESMKIETQEGDAQSHGRLLWDFLQLLLNDNQSRYSRFIAWKHRESGVFKIVDPAGLAKLWGMQKNHPSMNYDKMSRALRYYYRVNILRKVQGERHCYQFLRNPSELKSIKNISMLRQQMQTQPPSTPTPIFDAKSEVRPEVETKSEYYGHYTNEDCDMPTDLSINSERRYDAYTPEKYNPVRDDRLSGRMQEFNFSQDPVELVCQPSFPAMDQEKLLPSSLQFSGTQPDLECQYQQNIRLIV